MDNKIIIVGGYCATGKSTFSNNLSQILCIPCFNKDIIKEILGNEFDTENNMVFQNGSSVTFSLMLYLAERFLIVGKECILESNFRIKETERIKELLEKYNCECLSFIFKGDLDVLYNRYLQRDSLGKRHWVHGAAGENKEAFISGQKQLDIGSAFALTGKNIIVDSTSFADINYEVLYSAARLFIRGEG